MPDIKRSELTALVGSRICHDLISPLGAIGNGVELNGGIVPDGQADGAVLAAKNCPELAVEIDGVVP